MKNGNNEFAAIRNELGLQDFKIRQKCSVCMARGLTLVENSHEFICSNCGAQKPLNFWYKPFVNAPELMTFRQASKIINANPTGSTLRRAQLEHRLTTSGRLTRKNGKVSKKEHLISKWGLVTFYLTQFKRRPKKKKELNGQSNQPT